MRATFEDADIYPFLDATSLSPITNITDVSSQIAQITDLISSTVEQVNDLLTVATGVVNTATDVATNAVGTVSGTVLKSRQIVDVGSLVDLNEAVALVVSEVSATLEATSTVTKIRKSMDNEKQVPVLTTLLATDVLTTLGSTITSLTSVLSVVTDLTSVVTDLIPANLLSLLGLAL